LHIRREGFSAVGGYKQSGHIDFPNEINLEKYFIHCKYPNMRYKLSSVIEHRGSLKSGHFLAYKRLKWSDNEKEGKWVYTSDENVQFCNEAEVHAAEAYMLFYEKV